MWCKATGIAGFVIAASVATSPVRADELKIGLSGGITGGTAGVATEMFNGYKFAVRQVNDQGGILSGKTLVGVVADDGCTPQQAVDAVTKLVNVSQVLAIAGPFCSGALITAANSVTIPAGIVLVSPGATSPELTKLKDNDTVFRTVASDIQQASGLAHYLIAKGTKTAAVSFVNVDYGRGLAEAFKAAYEAGGGTIAGYAGHEEKKPSYRSDLAELAQGGADTLVLFDYADTSGVTVLREAIENGFFTNFYGPDGMRASTLIKIIGAENLKNFYVTTAVGEKSDALDLFRKGFKEFGGDPSGTFVDTSYDAVFVLALAIEKAGGDKSKIAEALREVANGPGETIRPGEWKKAKELIDAGKGVNYRGASGDIDFDKNGDVTGTIGIFTVKGNDFEEIDEVK